ncbi:MAG: hypothetical protein IJO63_05220 [Bacilli bacterium]|nr:hypothetical protein [Bacilli bacterium]
MKEFILGLYSNENFPIYLGVIIIVLVIAFFVVLFLGKKDKKKIEETQRLQKINVDAFKETTVPTNVAVPAPEAQNTLAVNQAPVVNESVINDVTLQMPTAPAEQTVAPVVAAPTIEAAPVVEAPVVPTVSEPVVPAEPIIQTPVIEMPVEPVQAAPVFELASTQVVDHHLLDKEEEQLIDKINGESLDVDSYKSSQSVEGLVQENPVPKFNPDPVIEPYIPEPDLSNLSSLASSIEVELNELEKQKELAKPILDNMPSVEPIVVNPVIEPTVEPPMVTPVIEMPVAPEITPVEITSVPVIEPVSPMLENPVPVTPVLEEKTEEIFPAITEEKAPSNPTKVMTGVFSSVYVPKKEEPSNFEETMAIELPKLKDTPVITEDENTLKL